QVVALLFLCAGFHLVSNPLADVQFGQPLALELEGQVQPIQDIEGLEQFDFLVEIQIGRVPGSIRKFSNMADRPNKVFDSAVVAAQLQDLLDDCPILPFQFVREGGWRNNIWTLFNIYSKAAVGIGLGRAGSSTM